MRDVQVKLHGYRIELGEIESVLTEHPRVREAVVLLCSLPDSDRSKFLVAFLRVGDVADVPLTSSDDGGDGDPGAAGGSRREPASDASCGTSMMGRMERWEEHLITDDVLAFAQRKLPSYEVPARMELLEAFPQTLNNKVDRKAIARQFEEKEAMSSTPDEHDLPGHVEAVLRSILAEVLGVSQACPRHRCCPPRRCGARAAPHSMTPSLPSPGSPPRPPSPPARMWRASPCTLREARTG